MSAVFGILNTTFKEIEPEDQYKLNDDNSMPDKAKISNFTGIKENLAYFERNSVHINKSIVVVNILDIIMSNLDSLTLVPMPSFFQYL